MAAQYPPDLRTITTEAGIVKRAQDAIQEAEDKGLPPLELYVAGDVVQSYAGNMSEAEWLEWRSRLAKRPALAGIAHADAPNRRDQAVAILRDAGLWPWE